MKLTFTRLVALLCMALSTSYSFAQAPSDLLIAEYVEGSANNKAIEIYNGTGFAVNLATGNYIIQMYFNASTTPTNIALTGVIAPNSTFVLAHGDATFITANGGSITPNQVSAAGAAWFNGNDAVVLRKGGASGTVLDAIGQIAGNPATEWGTGLTSTQDNTLRRKAADCSGDTNPSDAYDPAVKFDGFASNTFSGLGTHTSSCATGGTSIVLSTPSLSFTTTPGDASAQQSYTVQGNTLTSDVVITVPALSDFGIATVSGGPYFNSITIPAATANAGPVTIYAIFTPASAGTQTGNITHTSGTSTVNLAVQGSATAAGGITPVYQIQGTGSASPSLGNVVTTEGIVTADFQGETQLRGFFMQDAAGDGNAATSDGIFVFNTTFHVNVGDHVRLTGTVDEFFDKTEIKNLTALSVLSTGNALMPPIYLTLPVASLTDLEKYEGMRVVFPQTLTVSENYTLGRYGEVVLSAGGRLINPTDFVDPNDNPASGTTSTGNSNGAAVTGQQDLNNRRRILLDDASTVENPAVVPYLDPVNNTLRLGSTIDSLTGILDYDFNVYRLQPTQAPAFDYAARPAVPAVGGNVKVASFNVLNYFNGNGSGGGFPTSRGADTQAEFVRQRTKIIAAIKQLNADIVGLIEIENDGSGSTSAIADLVNGLNAATAPGTYAVVADPAGANGNTGTDEIKQALIYKPAVVSLVGLARGDMNAVHNRPPIAQTFTVNSNGEKFTVIVNHFKSKGCDGASGANVDQGDGQSCFNNSRKLQANALLSFIANIQSATGDADVIAVGDFNAYEQEDPMDILQAGGLINILPGTHSYVFQAQTGSLDYALVTPSVQAKLSGAGKWHINSDEPIAKDYNMEYYPAYVYSPDAFRSSDHDPVLLGIGVQEQPIVVNITNPVTGGAYNAGGTISFNVTATDADDPITKVEFYADGGKLGEDNTFPYSFTGNEVPPGTFALTAKAFNNQGDSAVSDTVRITIQACSGSGSILAEGYANIPGSFLQDLYNSPKYPDHPDVIMQLNKLEYGPNIDNSYGARLRGYICAPQTGNYTFYIASDDRSELWLSTDDNPANKIKIAYSDLPGSFRSYGYNPTGISASIRLVQGVRYYVETIHKEGTGGDHLSVAWRMPNGVLEGPIPGNRLSPYVTASPAAITSNRSFSSLMQEAGSELAAKGFTVQATPNPSATQFILVTKSNSDEKLQVTVTDVLGRVVEAKAGVAANGVIRLGSSYRAGIYLVQVTQGTQIQKLKLVKQ